MRHWGLGGVLFDSFYVRFMSNAMTFISSDVYIYDVYVYDVFIYECLCLYLNLHIYIYMFISTLMTLMTFVSMTVISNLCQDFKIPLSRFKAKIQQH